MVVIFVGLAFAQNDYNDYFNLFEEVTEEITTTTTTTTTTSTTTTEKPTTETTTEMPTTLKITTLTKITTTPATFSTTSTTTPSTILIGKMDTADFNARLENLFMKFLKAINNKMEKMPENFVKELSKLSTTTTTTTTTTTPTPPAPPPSPEKPLPPTPPPTPPPKVEKFLNDDVFEEDFFQDKKMEAPTEENPTYVWLSDNFKIVIGVSMLVGGTCLIVPVCIGICWFCTRNNMKKDTDFEMDVKKEEETEQKADNTVEEEKIETEKGKNRDRSLPPTPPDEIR
jgi:hypothetical protein